jgi:hypothetical protein
VLQSQNARFSGIGPADAGDEHPPGESLARSIAQRLTAAGWETDIPDSWRDAGWCFVSRRAGAELEVALAAIAPASEWLLQVAPLRNGGVLSRLLGRRPSATVDDVHGLARAIDAILKTDQVTGLLWCWDGMPAPGHGTPQPEAG